MNITNDLKQRMEVLLTDLDPMQHLRNLDYPRKAGTEGDQKAARYIADVLEQNGMKPVLQEFHFMKPKLLPRLVLPIIIFVWVLLSLSNIQYWDNNLIISLLVLALPLALILIVFNFDFVMKYFFGRSRKKLQQAQKKIQNGELQPDQVITSQNIIAEIGSQDAERQILFTAHYDSISSFIPLRVMTFCMMVGLVGLLLYSALYLTNAITAAFYDLNFIKSYFPFFAVFAITLLVLFEIVFLTRLFRGNDSHGIIDDGSGVAILLELAKFVENHEIPDTKFFFCFFGAEESGLVGSAYYYINRAVYKNKLHVISIDMIGEKPPLAYVKGIYPLRRKPMNSTFNAQIEAIAQSLDIEIKSKNFPYPGSDFGHFMLDGNYATNWLINDSHLIHSKHDNLNNVNEALVNDALKLVVAYLVQEGENR